MADFDATGKFSAAFPRAVDVVAALSTQKITAVELLRQTYAAIEERNPAVNAICTLRPLDEVLPEAAILMPRGPEEMIFPSWLAFRWRPRT